MWQLNDEQALVVTTVFFCRSWMTPFDADPQTSGGLLLACAPAVVPEALRILQGHGCAGAVVVGTMSADVPVVEAEP